VPERTGASASTSSIPRHHQAPDPARPSARAALPRCREPRAAGRLPGWTPRPALLPRRCWPRFPCFPDKPQLAALSAFGANPASALSSVVEGSSQLSYLCRACPTKPSPEHLTISAPPAVPSQHDHLQHSSSSSSNAQENPLAPSTPTHPGAHKTKCSFRTLLPVTCMRRRDGLHARPPSRISFL
jgi:hypothetical protein